MVPANGFIGFITSQGFFVGIVFAVLKFDDPIIILFYALLITSVFYMFGQMSVSYFVRAIDVRLGNFPKGEHEIMLDEYARALQKREDVFEETDRVRMAQKPEPKMVQRTDKTEEK